MMYEEHDFYPYVKRIWNRGESKNPGQYCFVPSDFGGDDDTIINKYDVTHYDLHWNEHGKSVKVTLYRGDSFGASLDLDEVANLVVNFETIND